MQPEIITKKFRLVGFEAAIDLKEAHWPGMDEVKASLKENLHRLGNLAQPVRFFDVWMADPKANYKRKKNHSRRMFFFGVEVTSLEGIPEGFVVKDFPETAFALLKEREHGHARFERLAEAGYRFDTKYAEAYAMDLEIYDDIDEEGPQWDALIPIQIENCIESFTVKKAVFELVRRPEVLWVGTLAWAEDNESEPDTDTLLQKYQALCGPAPKLALVNPDWSAGISINYCLNGKAPRGMLFAQETWSAEQDSRYDIYAQPAGLCLRLRLDKNAEKLMGKQYSSDAGRYALLEKVAAEHGYRRAAANPIEIFYHDHARHTGQYAIIPVEKG